MPDDPDWSTPASAPLPGDDQAELDFDSTVVVGEDVSCQNCEHFPVCAYFASIQPMLEQRENAPIDATDLAAICDEYTPVEE